MRKHLLLSLPAILLVSSLWAQEQNNSVKTLPDVTVTASTNVNAEVSNAFEKSFKNAVNPKWYRIDKNYLVTFITEDMNNRALYNKKGYMIYHIKYGYEKKTYRRMSGMW